MRDVEDDLLDARLSECKNLANGHGRPRHLDEGLGRRERDGLHAAAFPRREDQSAHDRQKV